VKPLRVLIVEDSEDDALLVIRALRRGGYAPEVLRVETDEALRAALADRWDVVISDYVLPRFDGMAALRVVREKAGPELPFVLVSGTIGEERAVEALKSGAGDFVTKQNLMRLVPAIEREIRDAKVRRERRETLEALREAVAARDQFLSIASHELRTPLTSLQLQVQSLQRALYAGVGDPQRVAGKLKTVARSTERLGELIDRLLDVSRITDGGRMDLALEDVDLVDLASEVVMRYRETLRSSGQQVVLVAPAPVSGRWDRTRLETIVTNLLSNAIKYGQGEPIELRVETAGGRARLSVTDHGIGIAPGDQARIFERFERAVPERHYGGFGLGLWVARLVAEAHGGHLEVHSEEGEGSTFVLELPLPHGAG
jgi:signal transduction histidine kinase